MADRTTEFFQICREHEEKKAKNVKLTTSFPPKPITEVDISQNTQNDNSSSPFLLSASQILCQTRILKDEIKQYTRHYLRTSANLRSSISIKGTQTFLTLNTNENGENLIFGSQQIQTQLQQIGKYIQDLKDFIVSFRDKQSAKKKRIKGFFNFFIGFSQNKETEEEEKKEMKKFVSEQHFAFYHAVILFLMTELQKISQNFKKVREMQDEQAKKMEALFSVMKPPSISSPGNPLKSQKKSEKLKALQQKLHEKGKNFEEFLQKTEDSDTIQQFQQENLLVQKDLQFSTKDYEETESSAVQISEMIDYFSQNLNEQNEQIDLLYKQAEDTGESLEEAKNQLQQASDKAKKSMLIRFFVVYYVIFCTFILMSANILF